MVANRWVIFCLSCLLVGPSLRAADDGRLEALGVLVQDESPRVRREALRALAKIPTARAAALALSVLQKPMDASLDYALWLTINDLSEPWIEAVRSGAWSPEGREKELEFALKALKPAQVSQVLGSVLGDRPLARDGSGPWIEVIGAAGSPAELARLFEQARTEGFEKPATLRALKSLADAMRLRKQKPAADLSTIAKFLRDPDAAIRLEAIRLAGQWREIGAALEVMIGEVASRSEVSDDERAAIFESLRQIGGPSVIAGLKVLSEASREPRVRRPAAATLAALDMTAGVPVVIAVAGTLSDEASALAFWRAVLGIKGIGQPLREALEGKSIGELAARAGMRVAREGGRDDIELVTALARAGGVSSDTEKLTAELIQATAKKALDLGDPAKGEWVFRRTDLACVTCHAIGGAGGKVGPDLTSIGASAPMDYLVEALLLPNAKIKEGYHSVVVEIRGGDEVTGTLARETQEELFLRNAAGQEVAVPKASILKRENGRLSLMPSGLVELLSESDRLDLYAFLSRLGKPGDYDASRGGVARLWRAANLVHTDLQNNEGDWFWKKPFDDKRWVTVLSRVNGTLTRVLLEDSLKAQAWTSKVALILATEVEQSTAGTVRFRFGGAGGELWVDGRSLGNGPEVAVDLPPGRHRVVLKLDPRQVPETVRLEGEGAVFVLH
ncbi:MAG: c-type cytochrome [Verrucomicrobiales bacterium]|nr:c-type cytochrome [Verrucomicrobiales bacterium]